MFQFLLWLPTHDFYSLPCSMWEEASPEVSLFFLFVDYFLHTELWLGQEPLMMWAWCLSRRSMWYFKTWHDFTGQSEHKRRKASNVSITITPTYFQFQFVAHCLHWPCASLIYKCIIHDGRGTAPDYEMMAYMRQNEIKWIKYEGILHLFIFFLMWI